MLLPFALLIPRGVAETAVAQETDGLYRASPLIGGDPFGRLETGRGYVGVDARVTGGNNAFDLNELGAIQFLAERDSLRTVDALDALGLVPSGKGITGSGDGAARLRLGVPLTRRLVLGVTVAGKGYGSFRLDDDAVALLRDGNGARTEFGLGQTRGEGLITVEAGAHGVWRTPGRIGPWRSRLMLGAGLRYVEPLLYGRFQSLLQNRSRLLVSGDSVRARVSMESGSTPSVGAHGSGYLADFMGRLVWPDHGMAVEASVRNFGRVTLDGLVRRQEEVDLATTRIDSVVDVVQSLSFGVQDTTAATVSPPILAAFTASYWRRLPVQLDARLLVPVGGTVGRSAAGELAATWRQGRLPVSLGLRMDESHGLGVRLGVGWETGRYFLRGSVASHGGIGGGARALAASFESGIWF